MSGGLVNKVMERVHAPVYASRLRELVRRITPHLLEGDRVLDVGCGCGALGTAILETPSCPPGVRIDGLETPVAPGSTVGGCLLINALKAGVAERLTAAGSPPRVLTAAAIIGPERARELFESAYDEHARRLARLYQDIGAKP